ncbi:BES15S03c [Trypanosoma grayi]|uniref:BES15S03c n=1 Tax=Trypanosoma grayi TaxID=71804 RepID=UPI0004F49D15|nr:BES15S03c [Trypanosoma grayi]KEG13097.1 BES15S03c [Trypanosoma grayi]
MALSRTTPATLDTWRTLQRQVYGITQYRGQPRLAGTQYYPCRSWGACYRAVSSIIRTKLLLSGNVEENHGPTLKGMQWNSAGLTQAKRLALSKKLYDDNITFCILSETKMSLPLRLLVLDPLGSNIMEMQLGTEERHTACLLLGSSAGQSNVWYRSMVLGRIIHLANNA